MSLPLTIFFLRKANLVLALGFQDTDLIIFIYQSEAAPFAESAPTCMCRIGVLPRDSKSLQVISAYLCARTNMGVKPLHRTERVKTPPSMDRV